MTFPTEVLLFGVPQTGKTKTCHQASEIRARKTVELSGSRFCPGQESEGFNRTGTSTRQVFGVFGRILDPSDELPSFQNGWALFRVVFHFGFNQRTSYDTHKGNWRVETPSGFWFTYKLLCIDFLSGKVLILLCIDFLSGKVETATEKTPDVLPVRDFFFGPAHQYTAKD